MQRSSKKADDKHSTTACQTCHEPVRWSNLTKKWTHKGPFLSPDYPLHQPMTYIHKPGAKRA